MGYGEKVVCLRAPVVLMEKRVAAISLGAERSCLKEVLWGGRRRWWWRGRQILWGGRGDDRGGVEIAASKKVAVAVVSTTLV